VQVAREGAPERRDGEAVSAAGAAPGALTLVAANERVVIGLGPAAAAAPQSPAAPVEKLSPETVREALAWQGPRLVFVDTPLAEVVAQFNRRNPVQLILADAELGAIPVGGTFRAENLEAFVRLLATDNDIAVEYPDAGHIVLRRRR
jgi:transmembrane sensor